MTNRIEIEKSGFNVPIGELDFFFSTSETSLMSFYDKVGEAEKTESELTKKYQGIDMGELESDNLEKSKEQATNALAVLKEEVKYKYDIILGEGTFEQLHKIYDLWQLDETYPKVINYMTVGIEKYFDDKQKNNVTIMDDYLKKQAKKKKKKKV